ncbi:hypothetical protein ACVWWR_004251 [Bradyrhizobium sp. LM3.2]
MAEDLFCLSCRKTRAVLSTDPDGHQAAGRSRPSRTCAQNGSEAAGGGYEAYIYEHAAGGHGYGKDNSEHAGLLVLGLRFLKSRIGWLDTEDAAT